MRLQIGDTVLGNWTIRKVIGSGSFGTVYEVEREEFAQIQYEHTYKAAVKVISLPDEGNTDGMFLADEMTEENITEYYRGVAREIIDECNLMEQMKGDSHIVSYEDHLVETKEDGNGFTIYIRMELLTPLPSRLMQADLSENEVIKLGIDICKALETCQEHHVIHRDIKPENIFVTNLNRYKLGDFGIARVLNQSEMAMSKKGTQNYMAPEVYKGLQYDGTVDLYSLGLVMFRLLNHKRGPFLAPFPEHITMNDQEKALYRRLNGEALPDPGEASGDLAEIIRKACNYEPSMRYANPREMRKALELLYIEETEPTYTSPVKESVEAAVSPTGGHIPAEEMEEPTELNQTRSIFHMPSIEESQFVPEKQQEAELASPFQETASAKQLELKHENTAQTDTPKVESGTGDFIRDNRQDALGKEEQQVQKINQEEKPATNAKVQQAKKPRKFFGKKGWIVAMVLIVVAGTIYFVFNWMYDKKMSIMGDEEVGYLDVPEGEAYCEEDGRNQVEYSGLRYSIFPEEGGYQQGVICMYKVMPNTRYVIESSRVKYDGYFEQQDSVDEICRKIRSYLYNHDTETSYQKADYCIGDRFEGKRLYGEHTYDSFCDDFYILMDMDSVEKDIYILYFLYPYDYLFPEYFINTFRTNLD